ncbi:MAG: (2Fe-2S)-binding protein [Planctomycetota bacterium]
MEIDDELCLCFHVSWRKVMNFIRIERVKFPSQLAECQSAGTGCGWCRKAMRRLVDKMDAGCPDAEELQAWLDEVYPNQASYAAGRKSHIASGAGRAPQAGE